LSAQAGHTHSRCCVQATDKGSQSVTPCQHMTNFCSKLCVGILAEVISSGNDVRMGMSV